MEERRLAVTTSRGLMGNIYLKNGKITHSTREVEGFAQDLLKHLPAGTSVEDQFESLIGSDGFVNCEEITDGVVVNKMALPLPKPDDPAHKNFSMPSAEEIEAMKEEILGNTHPEWRAKYGEASWETAMVLLGIRPSNPARDEGRR
ncbi:MAG: hypothetical protein M0Z88_09155 [Actinomycetota bacterium]|nr:hypothetical protein [Actinomycetota bacterium]MDA8386413.1 hypothetical protein [Actinomycetota bacterium]